MIPPVDSPPSAPSPPPPHGNLHILSVAGRSIPYVVVRSARRARWALAVPPNSPVELRIPASMSIADAVAVAEENASWIIRQYDRRAARPKTPTPRRFAEGESVSFLGKPYTLRFRAGLAAPDLRLDRRYPYAAVRSDDSAELALTFPPPLENPELVRRILDAWYTREASELFPKRLEACRAPAAAVGLPPPASLSLKITRSRWGCCDVRGHITLNPMLLQAPLACTDYVVCHELCHLRHMDHSDAFKALLTRLLPDWKRRRDMLRGVSPEWSGTR